MALVTAAGVTAQNSTPTSTERLPRFEDYPVTDVFKGTPAAPKIVTPQKRMYRTRIREGVSKGWGVVRDGKEQPGPNFAGHMIVVQWPCGAPCMMMAMADAQTGDVYSSPISFDGIGSQSLALPLLTPELAVGRNPDVEFRQDSSLMVIRATSKQTPQHPSYTYYFLWQVGEWKLLRRVLIKESEL